MARAAAAWHPWLVLGVTARAEDKAGEHRVMRVCHPCHPCHPLGGFAYGGQESGVYGAAGGWPAGHSTAGLGVMASGQGWGSGGNFRQGRQKGCLCGAAGVTA